MANKPVKIEIDKDSMYSKIMPSARRRTPVDEPASETAQMLETGEIQNPAPAESSAARSPAAIPSEPTPAIVRPSGVQLRDRSPMVVVNLMEYLVADKIDMAFDKFNCCRCDKCKKDVAAIALNKLKPKYVVAEQDNIRSIIAQQMNTDVVTAIVQSILVVRNNPRH